MQFPRGVTFIEMILYIALLAIGLISISTALIQATEKQQRADHLIAIEQKAGLLFSELARDITTAQSIDISSSILNSDTGTLVFVDDDGDTITINTQSTVSTFTFRDPVTVNRLKWHENAGDAIWLTDPLMDVVMWRIEAVRNDDNDLTGLNIHLTIESNADTAIETSFEAQTTIAISPQTTEL